MMDEHTATAAVPLAAELLLRHLRAAASPAAAAAVRLLLLLLHHLLLSEGDEERRGTEWLKSRGPTDVVLGGLILRETDGVYRETERERVE